MAILTPAFIDDMSWAMAEVYGAVTDQILINLAHYFPYFDESKLPASSFAYQASMLAQMGQVNRETTAIIRRALGDADDTLKKVLNQAIMHSVGSVNNALWGAVVDGIFSAPKVPVLAPNQMQAFKLYYQQAAQRLNLVNTVMLESTKQAYQATVADIAYRVHIAQSALNIAAGEAVTGVSTWNTAAKHAMDRLKSEGIVGFIDHGGHRWSAEAYTAMDIRTTVANTARAAVWETNESFGNDLYVVSYHNGARPGCYPWQNKVISSTDNARTVTDLDGNEIQVIAQSNTSYGQAAGLFGVNCKHYPSPFIPGVSLIRGEPQDEKANAKAYAESQEQRRLERRVREEKRDLLMEKARGAPQSVIDAQRERVRAAQADVQDFCDSTGRERRKDREGVYTKREFPDKNTYDVATFTRKQKKLYDDYWQNGGAQQGRTFGQMGGTVQPVAQPAPKPVAQPVPQPPPGYDIIEKAVGVPLGKPIDIEQAAKGANPDFNFDVQNTVNCQRCVQAYELRRRGYSVEAMPKPRRNNTVAWGSEIFNGYGKSRAEAIRAYTLDIGADDVKKAIENAPDGARFSIYIKWKSTRSAHVFIGEKVGGAVRYVDPQTGEMDVDEYFARGSKGRFGYFRMDDKPLTTDENLVTATVKKGR